MTQAEDRADWRIEPWAGTVEQLRQAAEQCGAKVAAAAPYPDDYDPDAEGRPFDAEKHEQWRNAQNAREVTVTVTEEDGYSRRLTSLDDLEMLGGEQLKGIVDIHIDIGGGGYSRPSAGIVAGRDRGLAIRLVGPDRTWTAGLRHELEEILKPVGRLRPIPVSAQEWYLAGAVLVFWSVYVGLLLYLNDRAGWSREAQFLVPLGAAVAAAIPVAVVGIRLPAFELLAPGDKPAYERWRGRILSIGGVIVLSVVASILAGWIGA